MNWVHSSEAVIIGSLHLVCRDAAKTIYHKTGEGVGGREVEDEREGQVRVLGPGPPDWTRSFSLDQVLQLGPGPPARTRFCSLDQIYSLTCSMQHGGDMDKYGS